MAKYRILYALLYLGAAVFALAYESKLSFVLFAGVALMPPVTFVLMLLSGLLMKIEVIPEADHVGKLQDFEITVKVKNRFVIPAAPMMVTGTFHDKNGSVIPGRKLVLSAAALRKCDYSFKGNISFRGEYMLGIENAEIYDLLRIFRFKLKHTPMCRITVMPRRVMLDETTALCTDDYDSTITKVSFMESGSFASVRKYADGDLMKHVHWKLSAKHDELMVKQSEQNLGSSALIITDLHSISENEDDNLKAADAAVETALALTRKIISDGRTAVNIYRTSDEHTDIKTAEKIDDYERLVSVFAVIPVTKKDAGAEKMISHAADNLTGSEPLFIITPKMKASALTDILNAVGNMCGEIRLYLTASDPDDMLAAQAGAAGNVSVWRIDQEDIALSLRTSMQ